MLHKLSLAIFIVFMLVLLPGCGSDGNDVQPEKAETWLVSLDASDLVIQARIWEVCGGTVICSIRRLQPVGYWEAFLGAATERQAACYSSHGTYGAMNKSERPYQCIEYTVQ